VHVALVAIDQLGACGTSADVASLLERLATDSGASTAPRSWHRAAHAMVALAAAAPDHAAAPLESLVVSPVWQLRMYGARAAATLRAREHLEKLARDPHANVAEAAVSGLTTTVGHDADALYIAALAREDFQIVRSAALALERSPSPDAQPALTAALQRVEPDVRPGAADARAALRTTLESLGVALKPTKAAEQKPAPLNVADLRRLAAPRARFTIRDVGVFDVALFTLEAPATVLQFAALAASGYYDGLAFHRIVPNGIVQGGGPGDNEYGSDAPLMRDEVGLWPHVRGAIGISTRGRDTGDGQIFIDLVDNPRYDHTYTVFAQVLNGLDVVDRILEGDVIDRIEILP
jgi:cyclophilin family peptidyl-prolyl cis-trans isomerase